MLLIQRTSFPMPILTPYRKHMSADQRRIREDKIYMAKRQDMTTEERIAKLEERVFQSHTDSITSLKTEMKEVSKKLTWLIVILAGNFGTTLFKGFHIFG